MGTVLVGLGLITSLAVAVSASSHAQPTLSPLDESDDIIVPDDGFVPYIAPTIDPNIIDMKDQMRSAYQPTVSQGLIPVIILVTDTPVIILVTGTPVPISIPKRIVIPAIELDAPVVDATLKTIVYLGKTYPQWKLPNSFTAGWAPTSASLGTIGNAVFFGHHNSHGEVFAHLVDLQVNDLIEIYSDERKFTYLVVLKMILLERNEPVDIRLQNARWILPSEDERLTLLTCWPSTSNTHRLIIVAIPVSADNLENYPVIPRLTPLAP